MRMYACLFAMSTATAHAKLAQQTTNTKRPIVDGVEEPPQLKIEIPANRYATGNHAPSTPRSPPPPPHPLPLLFYFFFFFFF